METKNTMLRNGYRIEKKYITFSNGAKMLVDIFLFDTNKFNGDLIDFKHYTRNSNGTWSSVFYANGLQVFNFSKKRK